MEEWAVAESSIRNELRDDACRRLRLLANGIVVLGVLGVLSALVDPLIQRSLLHAKLNGFLTVKEVEEMADRTILAGFPVVTVVGFLSATSIVLGLEIRRRKEWARRAWLGLCVAWFVLLVCLSVWLPPLEWKAMIPVGFRLVIGVVSFRILCSTEVRTQFISETLKPQ